jgi:hypothetical protein
MSALVTRAKIQNLPKFPPYIYHSGILLGFKKEILSFATTWMNLEDIMLGKISWAQKSKFYLISFLCGV